MISTHLDRFGKLLHERAAAQEIRSITFDTYDYINGFYFIQVESPEKIIANQKLICLSVKITTERLIKEKVTILKVWSLKWWPHLVLNASLITFTVLLSAKIMFSEKTDKHKN